MKKAKGIAIILLTVVFLFQCYSICQKSFSGYILNPKYQTERIRVDYVLLSNNLAFVKEFINQPDGKLISVFFKEDCGYDIGFLYNANRLLFYPMELPEKHRRMPIESYTDESLKESLEKEKNDYIIIVGKDVKKLNITTKKEISLYKVAENQNLELVVDYDNTLFNMREMSKKYKKDYYKQTMNYLNQYEKTYNFQYGFELYNDYYQYANDLTENGEEELATEYYNKYLTLPLIDPDIYINKVKIYLSREDEANAKLILDYCKNIDSCSDETYNQIKEEMEGEL